MICCKLQSKLYTSKRAIFNAFTEAAARLIPSFLFQIGVLNYSLAKLAANERGAIVKGELLKLICSEEN